VSRHSGSPTARINLRLGTMYGSRGVVLSVEDSGRGIAAAVRRPGAISAAVRRPSAIALRARPNNGVGLASMRERLHQLGGQLEVVSAVGRTVVTAVIPNADSGWQTPAGPTPTQLPRAEI
jgi:signal transduction histidine kinase